ncbi:hypothetical protein R1sor_001348 [Riccia sorocarpa]|uniref:YLP motif-containing protein 1 n=1 Tax=Riccia sorocarpa TaxID=122646 RepID=A0ABD3GXN2_9MARC
MAAFRAMGSGQGPFCPVCGYPHFPFCAGNQLLPPNPPTHVSFQGHLPQRPELRPPVHSPFPSSHPGAFIPTAPHPSSFTGQPVLNRGNPLSNLEPQTPPVKVLLSHQLQQNGKSAGFQDSAARDHGLQQSFHSQVQCSDSFHPSVPLSGMKSGSQSSQFPRTLAPSNLHSNVTRSPARGWFQGEGRDSGNVPTMPEWFDQKRRATTTSTAPNTQDNRGELGPPVSTFSSSTFKAELPVQRMVSPARVERDRQIGFMDGHMLDKQPCETRVREDLQGMTGDRSSVPQQGLHLRSDVIGHGGAQGVGRQDFGVKALQMKGGLQATFERLEGLKGGVGDGERRQWVPPSSEITSCSFGEQVNASRSVGHPRNSIMVDTAVGREEQLLREQHGLLDDSPEGNLIFRHRPFLGRPAEQQNDFGFVRGGPQITGDLRHGVGVGDKHYSGDKVSDGEQNLFYGNQNPPDDGRRSSEQNGQEEHTPPQDELDELYYLKHFPQHHDGQDTVQPVNPGNQFSDGRPFQSFTPSVQQAAMQGSFQETPVNSQPWPGDKRNTGTQHPDQLTHRVPPSHLQCQGSRPSQPHFQSQERTRHQNLEAQQDYFQQSFHMQSRPLPLPLASTVRELPHGPPVDFQTPNNRYQQGHGLQQSPGPGHSQLPPHQFSGNTHPNNIQQPGQSTHVQSQHHLGDSQRQPQHPLSGSINTEPVLQNQGSTVHHVQQIGPSPVSSFHLNAQGMHQQYGITSVPQQQASIPDGGSEKPQVSVGLGRVPHPPQLDSVGPLYYPPLPPPASAPPPPPPPPHSPPPSHSPPPAPPPVGSPVKEPVTFNLAGTASAVPPSIGVKQPDYEDHHLGFHYRPPHSSLHQPVPSVTSPGSGFSNLGTPYMQSAYGQQFGAQQFVSQVKEQPKFVNAVSIFRKPGRLSRPERLVVILRGLPGSGKSYLAKALRDVELMNGGTAPRIHSIDDYFMSEVEKEEEDSTPSSGPTMRGKKRVLKKVMEYCYEPGMEETYRASMLKAFRKTLEEGMFSFVIVDDRNVLVADFAQFWAIAKRSGYEVYLLEAPYKDPAGCVARNVHNFTPEQIQRMAQHWEVAPPFYLQLDISSLFRGDELNAQDITEVEMDADDMEREADEQDENFKLSRDPSPPSADIGEETPKKGDRWQTIGKEAKENHPKPVKRRKVKVESDSESSSDGEGVQNNALSGLMMAYGKKDKRVQWADQKGSNTGSKGFSIGSVADKEGTLLIGPGPGYNSASNPIGEDEERPHVENDVKHTTKFLQQYRAEQETFKAVFARRRHRVGGFDDDENGE